MIEAPPAPAAHASYDPGYFAPLFAIEDRHFWFCARNRVLASLVRQITTELPAGYRTLEAGCGTGTVLRVLEQVCEQGHVVGMDLFAEGLQFARRRVTCPLVQGDISTPPFREPFDLIGLFDVLEHLPDDRQVLRDLNAMLVPGGTLLLTVPAHQSLWSYFDVASHHCRRYALTELEGRLKETGFEIEYLTPYMASLFPLIWLGRRMAAWWVKRRRKTETRLPDDLAADELHIVPVVNEVLKWLLSLEVGTITHRRRLPFGTSLLAVARKRENP